MFIYLFIYLFIDLFIYFLVNKTFRFLNKHLKVTFKFSCDVYFEEKIFITTYKLKQNFNFNFSNFQ